jgi:hypothetical protein
MSDVARPHPRYQTDANLEDEGDRETKRGGGGLSRTTVRGKCIKYSEKKADIYDNVKRNNKNKDELRN